MARPADNKSLVIIPPEQSHPDIYLVSRGTSHVATKQRGCKYTASAVDVYENPCVQLVQSSEAV